MSFRPITALAAIVAGYLAAPVSAAELWDMPHSYDVVPAGYEKTAETPGVGAVWSDPAHASLAPSYCVYRARIVCTIYRVAVSDIAQAKTWPDSPGIGVPVDHLRFAADGEGLVVTLFYLDRARLDTIKPPYDYHY